nr:C-type mannose receptor 2-like [Hydra vulgaris]
MVITTKSWQDSYSLCLNYGGNLLSVADEAENLFIKNQLQDDTIKNQIFWIGLNDLINENIFEWSPVVIYNWLQNQPNNNGGNEDCVVANSVGWNDSPCDSLFGFICKTKSEKTYSVSFKLKPRSYSQGWKSVVHLTIGENYGRYGDRCPAVWFHGDGSGRLYISAAVNGNEDYTFTTQPLPLNQWSSLQISQFQTNGVYMYTIYLNELLVHSVINTKPQSFSNVKVYTADPWHNAQDGFIKDLKIITGYNGEDIIHYLLGFFYQFMLVK